MDNAQKAIMIGVGLFITIIVIAAVMLITGIGQDMLNSGTSQMQNIANNIDKGQMDSLIATYNGKKVGGLQAKNILRQAQNAGIASVTDAVIEAIDGTKQYTMNITATTATATAVTP